MSFQINFEDITLDNIGAWPSTVKYVVYGFVFSIILLAGYWFDISSQMDELNQAQTTEKSLRQEFERKQAMASSLNSYKQQLVELSRRFGSLIKQLPSKTEIPGLLEDISKSGVASGLEFRLFAPQKEEFHDFYAELPIKITVVGDYHQLGDFVSRLAGLSRIVTLHDFRISVLGKGQANNPVTPPAQNKGAGAPVSKGSGDVHLQMEVVAKTYRYVDSPAEINDAQNKAQK